MENLFVSFPLQSIMFFRKIVSFGFCGGIAVSIPSLYVLYSTWDNADHCDTMLRTYHVVRIALFFTQVPFRAYIFYKLILASHAPTQRDIVDRLLSLVRSSVWKVNQYLGVLVYVLFVIAFAVAWQANHCAVDSPALYLMCVVHLMFFTMHMSLSIYWLRYLIALDPITTNGRRKGASTKDIIKYTSLVQYDPAVGTSYRCQECYICMSEFNSGCKVMVLRCMHNFHLDCITPWLQDKRCCPLCMREIDFPIQDSAAVTALSVSSSSLGLSEPDNPGQLGDADFRGSLLSASAAPSVLSVGVRKRTDSINIDPC